LTGPRAETIVTLAVDLALMKFIPQTGCRVL